VTTDEERVLDVDRTLYRPRYSVWLVVRTGRNIRSSPVSVGVRNCVPVV